MEGGGEVIRVMTGQAGRCRERRHADHIFIQIYSRMHHFVVKFSKFSSPQAARGIDLDTIRIDHVMLALCGTDGICRSRSRVLSDVCTQRWRHSNNDVGA